MNTRDDMSDSDVLTAVRDRLSGTPLARPPDVDAIMARGRARRNRRLIPGVTGTLALAAGAALAVTALAPASHEAGHQVSHQASSQAPVRLTAWTVTRLAGGNISVTIRELKDPAGLQRTLRADGVPASVTFTSQQNPACRSYPGGTPGPAAGTPLLRRVFPKPYREFRWSPGRPVSRRAVSRRLPPSQNNALIVIHPSALPGNAGVQIASVNGGPDGASGVDMPTVVYASPQCTGS
jgi:hypothetical protein